MLQEVRETRGLISIEVAKICKVSQPNISYFE